MWVYANSQYVDGEFVYEYPSFDGQTVEYSVTGEPDPDTLGSPDRTDPRYGEEIGEPDSIDSVDDNTSNNTSNPDTGSGSGNTGSATTGSGNTGGSNSTNNSSSGSRTGNPQTGDSSMMPYLGLILLSGFALLGLRKSKEENR